MPRSYGAGRYGQGHARRAPAPAWSFGDSARYDPDDDLVGIGADLEPGTLLAAYRRGLFPMPSGEPGDPMYWFCPVRRGVLPLDGLLVSQSLRRSARDFEIRVDTAFAEVVDACGDPIAAAGWIDGDIRAAYLRLHELGWAHSVEAWRDGRLVGGLYGVAIGGLFAGESMFHHVRDASKVALLAPGGGTAARAGRGAAARRAVADPAPGVPGCGRGQPRGLPASAPYGVGVARAGALR